MNWLKKKIVRWVKEDWENDRKLNRYSDMAVCPAVESDSVDTSKSFTVKVQTATGGRILTFNHYDRKTDRSETNVYVVPEEQNFNDALVKLINLESYR